MCNDKWLVELTKETVAKVDSILTMDKTEYLKNYGCETDRVDVDKIAKAETMISTLKFFLEKATTDEVASKKPLNE